MDYSTWKHLNDNGYRPVEYIYKPDNFSNPDFGLGIIAYGNKYGLEVKIQASQEDMDYAMSGTQLQVCGYFGKTQIDNLPYSNACQIYIRQNNGYYLGRQTNLGWYTYPDGTIVDNSQAHPLITPCDTDIHIVSTYYDSESDGIKTFLDGVQKATDGSKAWENDLTAGTEYFVYGSRSAGGYSFKGRIYYIKTFDPDKMMTGHFLPCVRKSDERAGLYDVVNSVFKVSTYDYIKAGPNIIVEQIPWEVGTGNIRLMYIGVGNGTIIAESDENNLNVSRSQSITVETTKGSHKQTKTFAVSQAASLVDLGLPSGLLWATGNIVPNGKGGYKIGEQTDYGGYFSWGNIVPHFSTKGGTFDDGYDFGTDNSGTYASTTGNNVNTDIASNDAQHDAALACLGAPLRLPTKEEFKELDDNTDKEWTTINGISGWKFMKKIDHSIYVFFPAAGYGSGMSLSNRGRNGIYWSSSWNSSDRACSMLSNSSSVYPQYNGYLRCRGFSVRAVCNQ